MNALEIRAIEEADYDAWREMWTDYLTFYESSVSDDVYKSTFSRLLAKGDYEPNGLIALLEGRPVGLVHFMQHRHCWSVENACYLQDLFTAADARGNGVGEALIEAVRANMRDIGISNVYWLTQDHNTTARKLYDRVAKKTDFIKYGNK